MKKLTTGDQKEAGRMVRRSILTYYQSSPELRRWWLGLVTAVLSGGILGDTRIF